MLCSPKPWLRLARLSAAPAIALADVACDDAAITFVFVN